MVRAFSAYLIVCVLIGGAPALAQKAGSSAQPQRDRSARGQKAVTRSGVAVLDVDFASGRVTRARMLKSTGNAILDDAAVKGFLKYRFKPKTIRQPVQFPITFTVTGADI